METKAIEMFIHISYQSSEWARLGLWKLAHGLPNFSLGRRGSGTSPIRLSPIKLSPIYPWTFAIGQCSIGENPIGEVPATQPNPAHGLLI